MTLSTSTRKTNRIRTVVKGVWSCCLTEETLQTIGQAVLCHSCSVSSMFVCSLWFFTVRLPPANPVPHPIYRKAGHTHTGGCSSGSSPCSWGVLAIFSGMWISIVELYLVTLILSAMLDWQKHWKGRLAFLIKLLNRGCFLKLQVFHNSRKPEVIMHDWH